MKNSEEKSLISTKDDARSLLSRKQFLKASGLSAAAMAGLSSCTDITSAVDAKELPPLQITPDPRPNNNRVWIGAGDVGLMNTIHIYMRLEADFYKKMLKNPYKGMDEKERGVITSLKNHEVAHSDFMFALLGDSAIKNIHYDFENLNFTDRSQILRAAFRFENIGISMYNHFPELLKRTKLVTALAKIGSAEARQASAVAFMLDPGAVFVKYSLIDGGLDVYNNPGAAWRIFGDRVVENVDTGGLPEV